MTDWDTDSQQLRDNLKRVLRQARDHACGRKTLDLDMARAWQEATMQNLAVPRAEYIGRFRGEPGLENCELVVGTTSGTPSTDVAEALSRFEEKLQRAVTVLDDLIAPGQELSADDVAAVIDLCAWAHAEWIRIHPFANGNGRTARLWANYLAMRYGLPPFVRLRPRPDDGYGAACAEAMQGNWQALVPTFRRMYRATLQR